MKSQMTRLILILLLLPPTLAGAQSFDAGLIGGLSMGAVEIEDVDDRFAEGIEGDYLFGYEAGVFARLSLGPAYIRPQLMYRFQTGEVTYRPGADQSKQTSNFQSHRLQIPVMIGLHVLGPLSIEAGPVYNYLLSSTERFGDNDVSLSRNGIGYRVGPAIDLNRFMIFASYEGMVNNDSNAGRSTFREPYRIIFGLGIALGTDSGDDDDDDD